VTDDDGCGGGDYDDDYDNDINATKQVSV